MASIRGYTQRFTGSFTNIGTSYTAVAIATPSVPPAQGFWLQLQGEITGGSGTALKFRLRESGPAGRIVALVEDEITGDPITAPVDEAPSAPVFYVRGAAGVFTVDVACDSGANDTDGTIEVTLKGVS